MALIPLLTRYAWRFGLIDRPEARKVHIKIIPRVGGIAMVIGALIPILMWVPLDLQITALLLGAMVIVVFGVWDDRKNLDYRLKFFGQFVAVLIVVLGGGVVIEQIPFGNFEILPGYIAIPLTIFALLGVTNAINLADGLDGLAGGTTLLSFGGLALLSYMADGLAVALVILAIIGALLGFLRYNTWPAQIFMGDAGSQFLGFSLGVLVILVTQNIHQAMSPATAILLIGLPLLDTLMVMSQRLVEGRSPFSPDRNHLHHKFLDLGFDHYQAVFFIYLAQALLVTAAYILRYQSDFVVLGFYFVFCTITMGFFWLTRQGAWGWKPGGKGYDILSLRWINWLRQSGWVGRAACAIANISVSIFLVCVATFAGTIPKDFGIMAWLLFGLLTLSFLLKRYASHLRLLEQIVIYSTSAFVIYLLTTYPGNLNYYTAYINAYLALLALAVMVGVRFTRGLYFKATPLDFLVLFIALVVPNLPDSHFNGIGMAAAKLIVLFYAIEFVLGMMPAGWRTLRVATLSALVLMGLRGAM